MRLKGSLGRGHPKKGCSGVVPAPPTCPLKQHCSEEH